MSRTSGKLILWVGQQSTGRATSNSRYYELLRRFTCVAKLGYPPVKGIRHLERVFIPRLLPILARQYPILFDPGAQFTHWWPCISVVDVDDPTFTTTEIERLKDKKIAIIVTTTPQLAERLHSVTGQEVKVIPSGFSARDISPDVVENIRRQLKAKQNPVVGYVSPYLLISRSFPHQNDVSLLLDSMEYVWRKEPDVELWLIGVPDKHVKNFAVQYKNTKLLGPIHRHKLLNYVCNFDIAVYPRRIDHGGRFSVKLIEYMGCGVPIVATNVAESQIVEKACAGIIAQTKEEFAEAILVLVRDQKLREQLSMNAKRFSKDYDWDFLAASYQKEIFGPLFGEKVCS